MEGGGGGGGMPATYLSDGDGETFTTGLTLDHIIVRRPLPGLHLRGGNLERVRLSVLHIWSVTRVV